MLDRRLGARDIITGSPSRKSPAGRPSESPDLEEYLWGDSFWGDGYFAESVGQAEEAVVRPHIQNQGLP